MKVACGNTTEEELKKAPYIECLKFSGMQMDSFSGFFGGEVRLGILCGSLLSALWGAAIFHWQEHIKKSRHF